MSAVVISSGIAVCASAADNFTISNPYANINWSTVNQYKTALHSHTNASDGDITLRENIQRHYETGFDIVATTDHGVTNYSWSEYEGTHAFTKIMQLLGRSEGDLDYLGTSGTFTNGVSYKIVERNGDDYLQTDDGAEIMRIPYGIENNAVSINAHVNSWFADFRRNLPSDYVDAVEGVDKAGGLSVINHPGEYTQARYELYTKDAYNLKDLSYKYYFQKFYGLINKYDSCLGIDINSKGDARTRYERKLWDLMLTEAAKSGKSVYAICSSDAHQLDKIDTGCVYVLAKDKTTPDLKAALSKGEFFAASTCIENYDELCQIAEGIKTYYGETKTYNAVKDAADEYARQRDEKAKSTSDGNVDVKYTSLDNEGYLATATRPEIKSVKVDDVKNTISVKSNNALIVRWISDGKLIATQKASEATIDLDDYSDEIGGYIRAEVFGEGGIIYTQSFTLNADSAEGDGEYSFVNHGILDVVYSFISRYSRYLVRIVKNLFNK